MKVLFITHYSGFYGANKSLLQLVIELRDRFKVEPLIILPETGLFTEELIRYKIPFKVFRYYNWLNKKSFIKGKVKKFFNTFLFYKVFKSLKNQNYICDLIHTNSSATNLGGYLYKKMNVPHIWHIREYGMDDYDLKYYEKIERAGAYFSKNSSLIICISKDLKGYYSQYIKKEKIIVVYNGVKKTAPFFKDINLIKPLNICFLGVISKNKNQIEAIKALAYIKNSLKISNFKLNIVGGGSNEYIAFLKKKIKNENLEDNIVFNGFISDVDGFLKSMDVGIVSSKREAFGRVTVEFMMNKIAVIACSTGANKEIVSNSDLGVIYNYGNYKEMGNIISYFINNRVVVNEIGNCAHNHVVNNFSSDLNTKAIFDIYTKLLKKDRSLN